MLFISGDSDGIRFAIHIHAIHVLTYVMHIHTELVPPVQMKQLYEAAVLAKVRELFSVSGGHHNDTWLTAGSNYYKVSKHHIYITCTILFMYVFYSLIYSIYTI